MWRARKAATTEQTMTPIRYPRPNATCSAVIVTCNEADLLDECLRGVAEWADEIVVVDMHSTDGTQEVARRYTDRIFTTDRLPYADPARNYALGLASADWILMLDADERMPAPLLREIKDIAREDQVDVVRIPRHTVMFGTVISSPGLSDGPQIRFFRRGVIDWPWRVHGQPDLTGLRVRTLEERGPDFVMWHDTWRSTPQVIDKLMRYVPSEVINLRDAGKHFSSGAMMRAGLGEFYRMFLWGKAYEDGMAGFFGALFFMFYRFAIYAALWEAEGRTHMYDGWVRKWGKRLRRPVVGLTRLGKGLRGR